MKASGVDPALIEEIGKVLTWPATAGEIRRAMKLVPDEAVQMITASGTPRSAGPRSPSTSRRLHVPDPVPARRDVEAMIDTFADGSSGRMDVSRPALAGGGAGDRGRAAGGVPIAGGTDVMVALNFGRAPAAGADRPVRVAELNMWRPENGVVSLGAGVTYARIAREIGGSARSPRRRARRLAQIRNRATVGGNLGTASPAATRAGARRATGPTSCAARSATRKSRSREFLVGPKRTRSRRTS